MELNKYYIYDADNGEYYGETHDRPTLYFDTEEDAIYTLKQITAENIETLEPGEVRTFEICNIKPVKKFYVTCQVKMETYDLDTRKYEDINFEEEDEWMFM